MLLVMSENIARNKYSSQGIINYPTQLHFIGHFRILYHDARKHEYQVLERTVAQVVECPHSWYVIRTYMFIYYLFLLKVKIKVKFTLEMITKAQR